MNIIDDLKLQYRTGGIINRLIFWNIGCFLISLLFFWQFKPGHFVYPAWLSLSSSPEVFLYFPWTLLSYAFLHSGFLHLLFNMIVLNFAGRLFLTYFNPKQLLGLYVLSAIFAGLVFVGAYSVLGRSSTIVGASAAIMAVLVAVTVYNPLMELRLLLIGNVKLWHVTAFVLILDLMQMAAENTGGHIAHLAGALFGFVYVKLLQNGTDISIWVSGLTDFVVHLFTPKKSLPFRKVHKNYNTKPVRTVSKIVTKDKTQQQIDEILDKISQSGYDSLTKDEKEFLFTTRK